MRFGFLSLAEDHESQYAAQLARRSRDFGLDFIKFTPFSIDPKTELAEGLVFDTAKGGWTKAVHPLPEIIYDRCFYGITGSSPGDGKAIVSWLKQRGDSHFIGNGLPDKLKVAAIISADSTLKHYLPETHSASSPETVIDYIEARGKVILKPAAGSQGKGIIVIEKEKASYIWYVQSNNMLKTTAVTADTLKAWLRLTLDREQYLLQPYLQLIDHDERPFDIRILLQKDENGGWVERGIGVRRGRPGTILSNLHAGAAPVCYTDWTGQLSKLQARIVEDEILTITERIPAVLEKAFPSLFELGIDLGVARNGSVWILDINSKPGHQLIRSLYPSKTDGLYRAPLAYAAGLIRKGVIQREENRL